MRQTPPIHPFVPQAADAPPIEVQRLDGNHVLHRMGLHGHTFFELIFIEQAGGLHRVGRTVHPAEAGTLIIIPPGELHDCSALGADVTGWVLLFTHEALEGATTLSRAYSPQGPSRHLLLSPFVALGRRGGRTATVSAKDGQRWSQRFRLMADELDGRTTGYRYGVHAHLSLTLLDLLRLNDGPGDCDDTTRADPLLGAAFDFIERCYARPISAQDVARAVKRNAAHLTTTMRRRTGLTAGEWIMERRMAEVRRLLVGTGLDLAAIADRSGYSNPDALARAFRRAHRLTPAAWREAHRGQPPYA